MKNSNNTVLWQNSPKYAFNAKELDEETGMYYYEARYYAPPTFTSRDPLFEKYFWMSPYAYCANNPVKYVDPDGRTVYIAGESANEATNLLSTKNIIIKRDSESGKLSVEGKAKNRNERLLVKAINSEMVTVNITANKTDVIGKDENGNILKTNGGSFMGNTLEYNENGKVISATASQYVSMDALNKNYDTEDHGAAITHEITEGYIGGRISMRIGKEASPATSTADRTIYNRAHNRASLSPLSKEQKRQIREASLTPEQKVLRNVIKNVSFSNRWGL